MTKGAFVLWVLSVSVCHARGSATTVCQKVTLGGEVRAGKEWNAAIGQGWVIRVLPIVPGLTGYSGWDLAVDRSQPTGYPDALLLATLPYKSINEREVGTTYGLRAQDAIGWNPRSFHFLSIPADFSEAQQLYRSLSSDGIVDKGSSNNPEASRRNARAMQRLMALQKQAATGEFRILDAGLVPGVADPPSFAQNWALASASTTYQVEPSPPGKSTALGRLNWIRFSITIWLPAGWKLPPELHGMGKNCPE